MSGEPADTASKIALLHDEAVTRGAEHYIDPLTGFLVMTELHHLTRGSCCDNKCRHCPYGT